MKLMPRLEDSPATWAIFGINLRANPRPAAPSCFNRIFCEIQNKILTIHFSFIMGVSVNFGKLMRCLI